jgi:hypothetical protein
LEPGDLLDIRLAPDGKGGELATAIWANLVKIEGVIGAKGSGWVELFPFEPQFTGTAGTQPVRFLLDGQTELAASITTHDLHAGRAALVVGYRGNEGVVRATKVILGRN